MAKFDHFKNDEGYSFFEKSNIFFKTVIFFAYEYWVLGENSIIVNNNTSLKTNKKFFFLI